LAVPPAIGSDFTLPPLPRIRAAALQKQPALAMAQSRQRRAAALLAAARGERLPRAQLQAAYGWDTLGSPWGERPGWSAGVSVSVPLFDAGELRDRADAARLKVNAAKARVLQARLDLRASLATVWGDAGAALNAYRAAGDLARTKRQIWQISKEGYRAGRLSSLDLLLAQRDWIRSQQAELADSARLRLALVRLRLLAGQLPADNNQ
jgi:outer membrane protein TolC